MLNVASIRKSVSPIAKQYGLRRVYLFGSYAKGTADEDSDVDLLIEIGEKLSLIGLSGIIQQAREALNRPVDVVTTSALDDNLRESIAGTGVLLYEG